MALALLGARVEAQEVGEGELWVLPHVMEAYREFQRRTNGMYFAVSTNGWVYNYVYCPPSTSRCDNQDAKRDVVAACQRQHDGQTGRCFLFGNTSHVMWRGSVHVVGPTEWAAWVERNADLQRDLERFTLLLDGAGHAAPTGAAAPAAALDDYRLPPEGFELTTMACLILDLDRYAAALDPDFLLADPSGRYCVAAAGYHAALEQAAFREAAAACSKLAGGQPCYVYRAGRETTVAD